MKEAIRKLIDRIGLAVVALIIMIAIAVSYKIITKTKDDAPITIGGEIGKGTIKGSIRLMLQQLF